MKKILIFGLIGIFLIGIIFAGGLINQIPSIPSLSLNNSAEVITESNWNLIKATGNEENLTLWLKNAKDKKTEIGFLVKENKTYDTSKDLCLYDENGDRFLDDEGFKIKCLKYESSKCDKKDCYHISLTNAQAVNINDYIKFGENSIIIKYQNESRIRYYYDWGYTDFILEKGIPYNKTITEVWYSIPNENSTYNETWDNHTWYLENGTGENNTYEVNYTSCDWNVLNDIDVYWNKSKVKMSGIDNSMDDKTINKFRYKIITYTNESVTSWINPNKSQYVWHKEVLDEDGLEVLYKYPRVMIYHENPENIFLNLNKTIDEPKELKHPELRHIFDFEDICKNNYSKCEWNYFGNETIIYFNSKKYIDPVGTSMSSCGTITTDRYLSANLVTTGDCIAIDADNVALDLNGHYIDGNDGVGDYGIYGSSDYGSTRIDDTAGGSYIQDFERGINFGDQNNIVITDFDFKSNKYGIITGDVDGLHVSRCNFYNNERGLRFKGEGTVVSDVNVYGSTLRGLFVYDSTYGDTTIDDSYFEGADQGCYYYQAQNVVMTNTVCNGTGVEGIGLYLRSLTGITTKDNDFYNSDFISDNAIKINSEDGVSVTNNMFKDCSVDGSIVWEDYGEGGKTEIRIEGNLSIE